MFAPRDIADLRADSDLRAHASTPAPTHARERAGYRLRMWLRGGAVVERVHAEWRSAIDEVSKTEGVTAFSVGPAHGGGW